MLDFKYPSGYSFETFRFLEKDYTLVRKYFGPGYVKDQEIILKSLRSSLFATHCLKQNIVIPDTDPAIWLYVLPGNLTYLLTRHLVSNFGNSGKIPEIEAILAKASYQAKLFCKESSFASAKRPHRNLQVHPFFANRLPKEARLLLPNYLLHSVLEIKELFESNTSHLCDVTVVDDTYDPERNSYDPALTAWLKIHKLNDNFVRLGNTLYYQKSRNETLLEWEVRNVFASLVAPFGKYAAQVQEAERQAQTRKNQTRPAKFVLDTPSFDPRAVL